VAGLIGDGPEEGRKDFQRQSDLCKAASHRGVGVHPFFYVSPELVAFIGMVRRMGWARSLRSGGRSESRGCRSHLAGGTFLSREGSCRCGRNRLVSRKTQISCRWQPERARHADPRCCGTCGDSGAKPRPGWEGRPVFSNWIRIHSTSPRATKEHVRRQLLMNTGACWSNGITKQSRRGVPRPAGENA